MRDQVAEQLARAVCIILTEASDEDAWHELDRLERKHKDTQARDLRRYLNLPAEVVPVVRGWVTAR